MKEADNVIIRNKARIFVTRWEVCAKLPFAFVILAICSLRTAGIEEKPNDISVKIEPGVLDFGQVKDYDGPQKINFLITNTCDRPVNVSNIVSGCGCTSVKIDKPLLNPKEMTTATATIATAGYQGDFSKHFLLTIDEQSKPIKIPVRGKIIRDIWFDGRLIKCYAKISETTIEKNFEISIWGKHDAEFNYELIDKSLHLKELSRVSQGDETIIKFHLTVDISTGEQHFETRYLLFSPKDKHVKELLVPIAIYRSHSLADPTKLKDEHNNFCSQLHPRNINLGIVSQDSVHQVDLEGLTETSNSPEIIELEGFPDGIDIELSSKNMVQSSIESLSIKVDRTARIGILRGTITIKISAGNQCTLEVVGIIVPSKSRLKSFYNSKITLLAKHANLRNPRKCGAIRMGNLQKMLEIGL